MLHVGNMLEVYVKLKKKEKRLFSRTILSVNCSSSTVAFPASNKHTMDAAVKDVCAVVAKESFAMIVKENIDFLDREIASALNDYATASDIDDKESSDETVLCNENVEDPLSSVTLSKRVCIDLFGPVVIQYYSDETTMVHDGKHQTTYEDGNIELLNKRQET